MDNRRRENQTGRAMYTTSSEWRERNENERRDERKSRTTETNRAAGTQMPMAVVGNDEEERHRESEPRRRRKSPSEREGPLCVLLQTICQSAMYESLLSMGRVIDVVHCLR